MTTETLIACRSLSKDYVSGAGVVRALRSIDLEIAQGEFVAIVGTSGSGKSTLMNILGCLDRPTRGSYELAGFDIGERSSDARAILRNRLIGFIFQGFNLLPRTTALENVELPLVYRGVSARERRDSALASLAAVGLADRVHHTPNQLSGGQQQRVAIARALVTGPPMLLADEPTGNLDTRTSLEVLALLQKLNRERGITIVLVTHEHDIAACASRVVTFRDGRIVSDVSETPVDAAAALAQLPGPDRSEVSHSIDPGASDALRLGGPVPLGLHVAKAAGGLVGLVLGLLYCMLVGGEPIVPRWLGTLLPILFAFFLESYVAVWYAQRFLGRPLTSDQRVRVALAYTLGVATLVAPLTAVGWMPWSKAVLEHANGASGPRVVAMGLAALVGLAAVVLARYLVLTLFAPLVSPPAEHKKTAA